MAYWPLTEENLAVIGCKNKEKKKRNLENQEISLIKITTA